MRGSFLGTVRGDIVRFVGVVVLVVGECPVLVRFRPLLRSATMAASSSALLVGVW
jgi:hypothetical protein